MAAAGTALNAQSLTVRDYIHAARSSYERIEDYQCRMHEFSIGGGKREEKIMNFFFKKPELIRIDVLDGDRASDRGSVGVYTGGNKITGHRGGLMKGMVLTVRKDNALAVSVRGETINQSNVLAVIERMEHLVDRSDVSIVEKDSHVEFEFIPFDPEANEGVSRDVVWIDRDAMLVIRNERYEGEDLVQQVIRTKYIINAGLPTELFDAHIDSDHFRDSGVPLIGNDLNGESVAQ